MGINPPPWLDDDARRFAVGAARPLTVTVFRESTLHLGEEPDALVLLIGIAPEPDVEHWMLRGRAGAAIDVKARWRTMWRPDGGPGLARLDLALGRAPTADCSVLFADSVFWGEELEAARHVRQIVLADARAGLPEEISGGVAPIEALEALLGVPAVALSAPSTTPLDELLARA